MLLKMAMVFGLSPSCFLPYANAVTRHGVRQHHIKINGQSIVTIVLKPGHTAKKLLQHPSALNIAH